MELTPEFELPREQDRKPIDHYLDMTLQYNYRVALKEGQKPSLYGPGVDLFEEDRLRAEHGGL